METLKTLLVENPFWTVVTLVLAEVAMAAIWYEKRTRRRAMLLLIPPAAGALLFLLAITVTTDRDRILSAAGQIAYDIQSDRTAALEEYLDPAFVGTYNAGRLDKEAAIRTSHGEKDRYRVQEIRIFSPTLEIHGNAAQMVAPTSMTLHTELGSFKAKVIFRLKWIKRPQGWRLVEAAEPEIQRI